MSTFNRIHLVVIQLELVQHQMPITLSMLVFLMVRQTHLVTFQKQSDLMFQIWLKSVLEIFLVKLL